jgi:hypothetical protein
MFFAEADFLTNRNKHKVIYFLNMEYWFFLTKRYIKWSVNFDTYTLIMIGDEWKGVLSSWVGH